jgi:DNA-binding CsgD family transcriptional regulator
MGHADRSPSTGTNGLEAQARVRLYLARVRPHVAGAPGPVAATKPFPNDGTLSHLPVRRHAPACSLLGHQQGNLFVAVEFHLQPLPVPMPSAQPTLVYDGSGSHLYQWGSPAREERPGEGRCLSPFTHLLTSSQCPGGPGDAFKYPLPRLPLTPAWRSVSSVVREMLRDRELEVLRPAAIGLLKAERAEQLSLIIGTVRGHVYILYGRPDATKCQSVWRRDARPHASSLVTCRVCLLLPTPALPGICPPPRNRARLQADPETEPSECTS